MSVRSSGPARAGLMVLQVLLAVAVLLPFFWMVSVSLKPSAEPFAIPARLWPEHPTLDNYVTAFRPEFRIYFENSVIVSLSTVVISVTLGLLAAYCFTRVQLWFVSVLMSRCSPPRCFRRAPSSSRSTRS